MPWIYVSNLVKANVRQSGDRWPVRGSSQTLLDKWGYGTERFSPTCICVSWWFWTFNPEQPWTMPLVKWQINSNCMLKTRRDTRIYIYLRVAIKQLQDCTQVLQSFSLSRGRVHMNRLAPSATTGHSEILHADFWNFTNSRSRLSTIHDPATNLYHPVKSIKGWWTR